MSAMDWPVTTDMISIRLEIPGFCFWSWRTSRPESVTAVLRVSGRRGHHPLRLLEVLDPRALVWKDALGHNERRAEATVEALGDVPRKLDVLPLVPADRRSEERRAGNVRRSARA